jgi:hypothetical protein
VQSRGGRNEWEGVEGEGEWTGDGDEMLDLHNLRNVKFKPLIAPHFLAFTQAAKDSLNKCSSHRSSYICIYIHFNNYNILQHFRHRKQVVKRNMRI